MFKIKSIKKILTKNILFVYLHVMQLTHIRELWTITTNVLFNYSHIIFKSWGVQQVNILGFG